MKNPIILAVESSCDESAIAIYQNKKGALANEIFSQIEMHRQYGGVVPELAARDHLKRLPILLKQALTKANCNLKDIDAFAYTAGPGLLGALMTGANYARSLAYALNRPAYAIHHMEGHLLSPFLANFDPAPEFPFLALLVSGGHTQLLLVKNIGNYELLGTTLDDSVGEAFDKTAKIMGLPYPGGPELAKLAEKGNPERFVMPRPMTNRPGLNFSFSGLKTHVRLLLEKTLQNEKNPAQLKADIAASFQKTIVDTLIIKCERAWQNHNCRDLIVAGGVSANQALREALETRAKKQNKRVFFPPLALCGDNALMIAYAAAQRINKQNPAPLKLDIKARWNLEDIKL